MKKILMVDDKSSISDLIVQLLKTSYDVESRSNGVEAMAYLQDGNLPDLIISDLEMPQMTGFELIKAVRESGFFSDIPIIILSSLDSSEDRIKCLKLGADDYMTKPFNPEELLIRIEKALK
ncbi:MAG: response regulator transcription factor [Phaeodactylibacter sp.]|nr:response regulator transcription factor [Phaeodactylibacter sp.]